MEFDEESLLDILGESYNMKPEYDPDLHLQEAIKRDTRSLIYNYIHDVKTPTPPNLRSDGKMLISANIPKESLILESEFLYPKLWDISNLIPYQISSEDLEKSDEQQGISIIDEIKKLTYSTSVARKVTDLNINLLKDYCNLTDSSIQTNLLNYKPTENTIKYQRLRMFWYSVRNKLYLRKRRVVQTIEKLTTALQSIPFIYILNNCVLIEYENLLYMLDYSQILMIHDTVTSRYLSYLACDLSPVFNLPNLPSTEGLLALYSWGDDIINKRGNDGYSIIKKLEPTCVGVHLDRYDTLSISHQFFEELSNDADSPEEKEWIIDLYNLIDRYSNHPSLIFEFFGCYRHFGHPTVNEEEGCNKMREHTRKAVDIDPNMVLQITGAWNRFFIINFIKKNKRWPLCNTTLDPEHLLYRMIHENITHFDEYMNAVTLEEWGSIEYSQEFEFDFYPDFLELLSDKSLSPYLLNWSRVYSQDLTNIKHSGKMKESRRVLMEILGRKDIEIKLICKTIQNRKVPDHWKVIGLHSKERELKINSRLFAMMVLEMRLYFCATEANIARTVFKYMPCQTMSWSETELLRHIHHVTQISENQDFVPITISLDFVKWNNRWRHEAVSPIFKNIDDLLGQPCLYTYSHEFFKSSYFYLSSHLNPPQYLKLPKASTSKLKPIDPKFSFNESETTWIGQDGGCEGLRQKGWTTVTSGSLLAAESILGIKGIITGQGDNQVIVAFFPVPEEYHTSKTYLTDGKEHLEKVVKNYLIFLKKISNQIGMDIKLEESWVSQKLFNYGKEILSDGIFLTSVLKKISRMFLSVSDNYPSLANRIASIHTAGHSACLKGVDPLLPYFIAVHEICNLILLEQISPITTLGKLRIPIKDTGTKIDDTYLLFLNIFPKDYGGFPVMCFLDYIYRGHPDPITSWLCWYKYSLPYNGLVLSILEWILSLQGIKDTTDYKMIIQDPVSLNWNRPINGVNIIKNSLESTLREVNKNDQINMLLKGCTGKLTDGIIRYLSTIEPFSPRVLNTIFRNSPEGARMDFISTFIDMRTLKNITNRKDMINLRSKLLECDLKWFEFVTTKYIEITHNQIIWRSSYKKQLKTLQLLESNIIDQQFCSTLIAEYLRNKSWRKKIQHVTVPHPYEQTRLEILEHNQSECLRSEYILYIYDPPQQGLTTQGSSAGHSDIRFMKGRFSPYYGSGTAPKISSRLLSFPKTDRSLIAAQALLKTKLWVTKPGSNLHNFLTQLISTRTPLPEDTLKASTGSYSGGSVAHRFDDVVTKHECRPNIRVNFFTQVYISSDTMGKYSKSLENYTIHFQGLFLSGLYAIQFLLDHKKELASQRVVFHQHIACVDCCMKIDDVYFDSCELPPRLNQMKNCRLLYSDIPDISKKLFWLNTKCIKLIGISDRNITIDRRSLAAGWILLGESVNNDNPLVHSPLKPIEEVKLNTHLTIASCLNIGVSKIIYSLTKIWFIENVDYLIRSSNQLNINLYLIARTHLVRSSSMLWSGIRDLMLFPDILNDFLKNTGMFPGSSNAFRGGSSMDILLSNFAHDCLKDILNHKDFQISLFCTTPHVGIIRIVKIWINSICLLHFNDKVDKLVKHLRSLHQIIYQCIIDDTFNLEEFFLRYEKYRARRSLPSLLTQPLILSQEGPEPWVRFVDSTSAIPLFDHLTMRIKSSQDIQLFWQIVSQLSLIKTHRLNLSYQKTVSVPLKTRLISRPMSVKLSSSDRMPYLEHTIKLTGLYSSSHYKFISLLSYFKLYDKITNVLCLGDGDGGVSRLMAICTTAKSIWYNSLIDLSLFPPHRAANYVPPELLSLLDNKEKTIHGIDLCIQYGGDFTNKEYQKHLVNSIKPNELQLIIMDAESFNAFSICEVMQMTNSVIDIISKTNTRPFVIFKTHLQDAGIMHSIINQFLSITNNLQVITPSLSSYSSQECFICFPVNNKTHLSMDQSNFWCWNDEILDDINLRVSNMTSDMTTNYLLSDEVTEEATQLNMYLQGIGYPSALNVCIQVLTADHIDYGSFLLSPVESLAVTSELLNHTILMRLISYGKLISNGKLSMNEYVFRGKTLSESKDLNSLSTILFNLRLMLIGYLYHFIDDQIFQEGITIQYKGTIIYQWIPDLHNWMKKYGRSWYKYWGWVREQFSDVRTHSVP